MKQNIYFRMCYAFTCLGYIIIMMISYDFSYGAYSAKFILCYNIHCLKF